MTAPSLAFYDVNGRWAVENEGVAPDIEVEVTPGRRRRGTRPELERAVQEALKLLEQHPSRRVPRPAPIKRVSPGQAIATEETTMTPRLRWSLAPLLLVAGIAVVHTRDGHVRLPRRRCRSPKV